MGTLAANATKSTRVEEVLVGVFGAFIGGEFLSAMLHTKGDPAQSFALQLGLAVAGAVVMLTLLAWMRRSVGPMRNSKSRARKR
ncbi:hypothetical protein [uncultured Ramlibacter sp.]|uniref:hypothetical protein n=1 Tax=uncultured Ramlibacter sp. TaxID=260755 RepID=UPI0026372CBE|nr:hypothetical protein [uncultured Ramlibacter sp.]